MKDSDFNSIKVRLELLSTFWLHGLDDRFQFHKGAIRTNPWRPVLPYSSRFQFHKGAIRTQLKVIQIRIRIDFNSIKVRLEPAMMEVDHYDAKRFQFHKGAIRTHRSDIGYRCIRHFNSIKVRLEHSKALGNNAFVQFQFHKGAIRTNCF